MALNTVIKRFEHFVSTKKVSQEFFLLQTRSTLLLKNKWCQTKTNDDDEEIVLLCRSLET